MPAGRFGQPKRVQCDTIVSIEMENGKKNQDTWMGNGCRWVFVWIQLNENIKIQFVFMFFRCFHFMHPMAVRVAGVCLCQCLIVLFSVQHLNCDIYKCFIVIAPDANTLLLVVFQCLWSLRSGTKIERKKCWFLLVLLFLLRNEMQL